MRATRRPRSNQTTELPGTGVNQPVDPRVVCARARRLAHAVGTAGSASSLIGAIGFTAGAIVSSLLGAAFDGSARPMATVAAFAGTAAFTLEWLLLRGKA